MLLLLPLVLLMQGLASGYEIEVQVERSSLEPRIPSDQVRLTALLSCQTFKRNAKSGQLHLRLELQPGGFRIGRIRRPPGQVSEPRRPGRLLRRGTERHGNTFISTFCILHVVIVATNQQFPPFEPSIPSQAYTSLRPDLSFTDIDESSVVFRPEDEWENYGTEDPRLLSFS